MRFFSLFFVLTVAPTCLAGIFTSSGTIDFTGQTGSLTSPGGSVTFSGWKFTLIQDNLKGSVTIASDSDRVEANNKNVAVLAGSVTVGAKPQMTLEKDDGGSFSLGTIDFGGNKISDNSKWADTVRITDSSPSGSGAFYDFNLDTSSTSYQTMSVQTTFASVTKVTFQGISTDSFANFTVDNIQFGDAYDPGNPAVPEPTTLASLSMMMLGGLACGRRRRRAVLISQAIKQ